jgi:hypothetical protein
MSETPRTDKNRFHSDIGGWVCYSSLCRQLELELNEANDRIKRMEDAGDAMLNAENDDEEYKAILQWNKYKKNKR